MVEKGDGFITQNQLNYLGLQETKRNNLVVSAETGRHNLATEQETARHNIVSENDTRSHYERQDDTARRNVDELSRHNLVSEQQAVASLSETSRHNRATEALGNRELGESKRSHKANEANTRRGQTVTARTNVTTAKLNAKTSRANAKTAAEASKFAAQVGANVKAYTAELQNAFNESKLTQDKTLKMAELANRLETTLANNDAEKAAHAAKKLGKELKDAGITGKVYDAVKAIDRNVTKIPVVGGYTKIARNIAKAIGNLLLADKKRHTRSSGGKRFK